MVKKREHILSPKDIVNKEQGRIHGNPVADSWAGAVPQKPLGIQKCDRRTDGPTDTARCRVACTRLKMAMVQLNAVCPTTNVRHFIS